MKPLLRALGLIAGASLLLGSDCMFGRPIVDEQSRYYPSDGVISCTGTRCADLPPYELELPAALDESPCAQPLRDVAVEDALQVGARLEKVRLTLSVDTTRDINLSGASIQDACIALSGPVRLTLGAGSSLSRVELLLGPTESDAGARASGRELPNVYVGHSSLERVSLHARAGRVPAGSAQLEFSTCSQCELQLDALNVTQSQVQSSRLHAASLTVVGGEFDAVELGIEYGLLAGLIANDLRTTACNTLSLVGATIAGRASKIGPCDCGLAGASRLADAGGPADAAGLPAEAGRDAQVAEAGASLDGALLDAAVIDAAVTDAALTDAQVANGDAEGGDAGDGAAEGDAQASDAGDAGDAGDAASESDTCIGATITQTTFLGGMVDGKVRAENSSFRSVLFARNAPTALDMWSTNIELSVGCHLPFAVRLDKTSGIGCTSCDAEGTAEACTLDRAPQLIVNKCESFSGRLPACEAPLPVRMTPAIPMKPKLGM